MEMIINEIFDDKASSLTPFLSSSIFLMFLEMIQALTYHPLWVSPIQSSLKFLVRMLLSLSADFTNTLFTISSSTYTFTYFYLMPTCLVWIVAATLPAMNIALLLYCQRLQLQGAYLIFSHFVVSWQWKCLSIQPLRVPPLSPCIRQSHASLCIGLPSYRHTQNMQHKATYAPPCDWISCIFTISETNVFPVFFLASLWFQLQYKTSCIKNIIIKFISRNTA